MSISEILRKLHEIIGLNKWDRTLQKDDQYGGAESWKDKGLTKDFIYLYIDAEKEKAKANFEKKGYSPDPNQGAGEWRGALYQIDQLVQAYKSSKGVTDQQAKKAIDAMLYAYANVDGDYNQIGQYADQIDRSVTDMITGDNLNKPILDIIRNRNIAGQVVDEVGKSSYTHTDADLGTPGTPGTPGTLGTPLSPEGEVKRFEEKRETTPSIKDKEETTSPFTTGDPLGTTDLGGDPFGMDLSPEERAYSGLTRKEIAAGLPLTATGGASPYARRTYQNLLNPLAQDNGVFSFLSTAGLTPRVALPGQPDVTNEALSFRAFLAQGPQSMADNINRGLTSLETAKELASTDNQKFWTDPTYATDLQKTLYTQFVDNPGNELALRQSLARRAYPGELGDVIAETLAKTYFATQATDPYQLTQPGFYKNAFQNYLPTTKASKFFKANKEVTKAAISNVVEDDKNKTKVNPYQSTQEILDQADAAAEAKAAADAAKKDKVPPVVGPTPPVVGPTPPMPPSIITPPATPATPVTPPATPPMPWEETEPWVEPGIADMPPATPVTPPVTPPVIPYRYPDRGLIPNQPADAGIADVSYSPSIADQGQNLSMSFNPNIPMNMMNPDQATIARGGMLNMSYNPNLQTPVIPTPAAPVAPTGGNVDPPPLTPPTDTFPPDTREIDPYAPYGEPLPPQRAPGLADRNAGEMIQERMSWDDPRGRANYDRGATAAGAPTLGPRPIEELLSMPPMQPWPEVAFTGTPGLADPYADMPFTAADQWIEPGIADMPGASPMGVMPTTIAPRPDPLTGEMIQGRMADRQPGPLGQATYPGGIIGVNNPSVDPNLASSIMNFPSMASPTDIQDVIRRAGPPYNPISDFARTTTMGTGYQQPQPPVNPWDYNPMWPLGDLRSSDANPFPLTPGNQGFMDYKDPLFQQRWNEAYKPAAALAAAATGATSVLPFLNFVR